MLHICAKMSCKFSPPSACSDNKTAKIQLGTDVLLSDYELT